MEIVPVSVGKASREWDEQHLDLEGAAKELKAADAAGFTEAVKATATSFAQTWEGFTRQLGIDAEAQADGLRKVIHAYLTSEDYVRAHMGFTYDPLTTYDAEVR